MRTYRGRTYAGRRLFWPLRNNLNTRHAATAGFRHVQQILLKLEYEGYLR